MDHRPTQPDTATPPPTVGGRWTFQLATLFAVVTVFAGIFAAFHTHEVLGLLSLLVVPPALLSVGITAAGWRRRGKRLPAATKAAAFFGVCCLTIILATGGACHFLIAGMILVGSGPGEPGLMAAAALGSLAGVVLAVYLGTRWHDA